MKHVIALFLIFSTVLLSCTPDEKKGRFDHLDKRTKIRLRQYLVEGQRLYGVHCANCHQLDGNGLARLYPPLRGSDYLLPNVSDVICGMRYGQKGEIFVNGVMFNQEMPGIPGITDLEVAEIATYVYTEFADSVKIFTLNEVNEIMKNCDGTKTNPSASGL